jgi:hypothetical protein
MVPAVMGLYDSADYLEETGLPYSAPFLYISPLALSVPTTHMPAPLALRPNARLPQNQPPMVIRPSR